MPRVEHHAAVAGVADAPLLVLLVPPAVEVDVVARLPAARAARPQRSAPRGRLEAVGPVVPRAQPPDLVRVGVVAGAEANVPARALQPQRVAAAERDPAGVHLDHGADQGVPEPLCGGGTASAEGGGKRTDEGRGPDPADQARQSGREGHGKNSKRKRSTPRERRGGRRTRRDESRGGSGIPDRGKPRVPPPSRADLTPGAADPCSPRLRPRRARNRRGRGPRRGVPSGCGGRRLRLRGGGPAGGRRRRRPARGRRARARPWRSC